MNKLFRSFGPLLTAVILLLSGVWILGMIVAPQIIMVEKSFWHLDLGSDAVTLSNRINNLYNEIDLLRYDKSDTESLEASPERDKTIAEFDERIEALSVETKKLESQETKPQKVYSLHNYALMGKTNLMIFAKTILASLAVTVIAFVVCYPIAYAVAKLSPPRKVAIIMLGLIIPYSINELLRIFAWLMILNYNGVANFFLGLMGIRSGTLSSKVALAFSSPWSTPSSSSWFSRSTIRWRHSTPTRLKRPVT